MTTPKREHSASGCAAGFGMAGCGIGSYAGTYIWMHHRFSLFEGQSAQVWEDYGGTLIGLYAGFALGAVVGVWFARRSRKPTSGQ